MSRLSPLDKLVLMANQIARNLAINGEEAATAGTAVHITEFWDPRMKRMIHEHLAAGGEGLSPIAKAALERVAVPAA